MPIVSIIVPVYNVESYIERCVNSLINQTLKDIEIILVNDGSTDKCGEICEKYAKEDSRIKVIHKLNGGLSSARNTGLDHAIGTYIGFIDSDDWVEKEMFEVLVDNAIKNKSDMVVCNYRRVKYSEMGYSSKVRLTLEDGKIDISKIGISRYILDYFLPCKHAYDVWNKLYRLDLIKEHNIRFEPNQDIFAEDLLFNLYYFCHTKLISTTQEVMVNYFVRSDSLSSFPYALLPRLTMLVSFFEKYVKTNNFKSIAKTTIPTIFCAQVLTSIEYFYHAKDTEYTEKCLKDLPQINEFKIYTLKTIFNKESSNYLKGKGYRILGRLYFKLMLIRLMLGQKSFIISNIKKNSISNES